MKGLRRDNCSYGTKPRTSLRGQPNRESSPVSRRQRGGTKGMNVPRRRRSEPNASESRFSLVNLIGGDQPVLGGEVCHQRRSNEHEHPLDHPGCLGRARSERSSRNLGYPAWCRRLEGESECALWPRVAACGKTGVSGSAQTPHSELIRRLQRRWGIHNPPIGRGRESERSIVAVKRGNARGAKGPCFSHVSIKERSPA